MMLVPVLCTGEQIIVFAVMQVGINFLDEQDDPR